jgi:hypothetical protein
MADRTIDVITPATVFDLLTLDEAKLLVGIPTTDTTHDAVIPMLISTNSTMIAELCNRTFAKEKVTETWRETVNGRLFLSHWPVIDTDVESVADAGVTLAVGEYELEGQSGKLSNILPGGPASSPWMTPAVVTYTGGYVLPDDAPLPLKHATAILIRDDLIRMRQAQTAGIRMIAHKESRVMFFDPNLLLAKTLGLKTSPTSTIDALLKHYIRYEV